MTLRQLGRQQNRSFPVTQAAATNSRCRWARVHPPAFVISTGSQASSCTTTSPAHLHNVHFAFFKHGLLFTNSFLGATLFLMAPVHSPPHPDRRPDIDNFYETGLRSANDPRFTTVWRELFFQEGLQTRWYSSLGMAGIFCSSIDQRAPPSFEHWGITVVMNADVVWLVIAEHSGGTRVHDFFPCVAFSCVFSAKRKAEKQRTCFFLGEHIFFGDMHCLPFFSSIFLVFCGR